jgi:hypothetical protein
MVSPRAVYEAELIRSKINRVRGELRILQTGLESYKLDYKVYPPNLFVLSTPIAYIIRVPKDSFNETTTLQYRKTADGYIIWSVGPDMIDEHGELSYDSTAGLTSRGDIIRHQGKTN